VSPVVIPLNTTPVCTNANTEPRGIERPLSAVANPLSWSPNHLLQMRFWALKSIGFARDRIQEPTIIGQKCPSKVLSYLTQPPMIKMIHANLKVQAHDTTVYNFILMKNMGTAEIP
jgi:hypothetical protein